MSVETNDPTVAAALADVDAVCASCKKTASVGCMDRWSGRWTCYSCGRINKYSLEEKR